MSAPVIIAFAVILFFGILGFKDGVVKRVLEIAGVFVTLVLTARFATSVVPWVEARTGVGEGPALLITWAVLFFAGLILSRLLASFLSRMVRLTVLGWLDRWGGAVVGMALGTLVASVLLVAVSSVPGGVEVQNSCDRTAVGRFIFYAAPSVYEQVRRLAGSDVDAVWDRSLDQAREKADAARDKVKEKADDALGR
ncbi:CvpA family protein [bacterium]|nr:CvpA family protein [bacterium]